jgi:hypothetical protein
MEISLAYNGTILSMTITDLVTGAAYSTSWPVNIPSIVGGNTAYVGFTGGTGAGSSSQKILTWNYTLGSNALPLATTPIFTPAGGAYTTAQSVSIGSLTSGATIRYTTDKSNPATSSTAVNYTTPISVAASETVNAVAEATGYSNSTLGSAAYTFGAQVSASMLTPTPGSTLAGSNTTFTWTTATGATGYILSLGSTGAGSYNLYYSGSVTATSATVTNLPTNGETIYARLTTNFSGTWVHIDYTYRSATLSALTAPTPGSVLVGPSTTFTWTTVPGATGYILSLGTTGPGSYNLYYSGSVTATSATFSALPDNGATIFAQLTTNFNGTWVHTQYTYTSAGRATLTSPVPGGTLTGSNATFTWTSATGATGYILSLGTTGAGSYNLYYSGSTTAHSATVSGLPTNGQTVYARLTTNSNGIWEHTDYTYTSATLAVLTTPTPGSTLAGSSVTFNWTTAAGATGYILSLGSTGTGSYNLYYSGSITGTSVTVNNLPTNGETIYARLTTNFNGTWVHADYSYTTP